jgi:hypothetical protein
MLGFLVGAVLWGMTYSRVFPLISKFANLGSVVIPDLWSLNPYLAVIAFDLMAFLLFYLIERAGLQRKEELE